MKKFAIMNGDEVENIIIADSLEDAEAATGRECIEGSKNNRPGIGFTYNRTTGMFTPNQGPWDSWTWDEELRRFVPPVPLPESGEYSWNEETLSWIPWTQ
jgi:hypothetical protein